MEVKTSFDMWTIKLAQLITAELWLRRSLFATTRIRALAVDFHPWHSILELSMLTDKDDAEIDDQAAWRYFQFTYSNRSINWPTTQSLANEMRDYYQAEVKLGQGPAASDRLLHCCARALMSPAILVELEHYNLADDFTLIVTHPDDPMQRNYCTSI